MSKPLNIPPADRFPLAPAIDIEHFTDESTLAIFDARLYQDVRLFRGKDYALSNWYPCRIFMHGRMFPSAEHAYQFTKAVILKEFDVARQIFEAPSGRDAQTIASVLQLHENRAGWEAQKLAVMACVLEHKLCYCREYQIALEVARGRSLLVENTSHAEWGLGFPIRTWLSPSVLVGFPGPRANYPGQNKLGRLHQTLAEYGTLIQPQFRSLYRCPDQQVRQTV